MLSGVLLIKFDELRVTYGELGITCGEMRITCGNLPSTCGALRVVYCVSWFADHSYVWQSHAVAVVTCRMTPTMCGIRHTLDIDIG